jgi:hypothetical protein
MNSALEAFAIAGHHAGLPDPNAGPGNLNFEPKRRNQASTKSGRLPKQTVLNWRLAYRSHLESLLARTSGRECCLVAWSSERTVSNPALSIPAHDFEFSDVEMARIKAAIQTWDAYTVNADHRWLQPLVEALFSTEPQ